MSTSDPYGQQPPARDPYAQDPYAQGGPVQGHDPYGQAPYGQQPAAPAPRNGLGVAALVVGIVSLLLGVIPLVGFVGLVAVVLGIVALSRVRRGVATNRGVSITGLVLGSLAVLAALAWLALIIAVANSDTGRSVFRTAQECAQLPQAQQQQCIEDGLGLEG